MIMRQFTKYPSNYVRASIHDPSVKAYVIVYYLDESDDCVYDNRSDFYSDSEARVEYSRWAEDVDSPNPSWVRPVVGVQYFRKVNGEFVLRDEKLSSTVKFDI